MGKQYRVFIDGQEGTTGLKIMERLEARPDLEILRIDEQRRKDAGERQKLIHSSDITFLCLPDDAAREAVKLAEGSNARIIDASTAHRTAAGWCYGFPELSKAHRERLGDSKRTTVPGCHASGMISLVYPLVAMGILPKDYPVVCHSITGYSGGGKKMIAQYEDENRPDYYKSPRQYALGLTHKHLPEMQRVCGLSFPPVFNPIVADFYSGMVVTVPVIARLLPCPITAKELWERLTNYYEGQHFVRVMPFQGEEVLTDKTLPASNLAGTNRMELFVCGNEEQILLCSRFDNLGKGASGAAVQCMNIMLGLEEATGLE